jgi:hypothetical protein
VTQHPWGAPFVVQYSKWNQTDDERCSAESQCLITQASIDWGTANVGIIVPVFSFISGAHHAAVALWVGCEGVDAYLEMAKRGNWLRAVDYALSSSLMLVVTSILFRSPPDVPTLMLAAAVQSAIILIGYLLERLQYRQTTTEEGQPLLQDQEVDISTSILDLSNADTTSGKQAFGVWIPFAASMLIYALVWTSLLIPFHYAVEDAPTAVVIFIVYLVATFTLFPIVFVFGTPGLGRETGFLILSMLAKVPLLMLFYFGIVARSGTVVFERLEAAFNTTGSPSSASDTELYIAFGASIAVVTIVAILMRWTRP